jgi:hypothetical protein
VNEPVNRLDVRLMPDDQPVESVFTGSLCTVADPPAGGGGSWAGVSPYYRCVHQPPLYATQIHHRLPVHRPGIMTVAVDYIYQGDYYTNYLNLEIRCGSRLVAEERIANLWHRSIDRRQHLFRGQLAVPEPCAYEIKVFNYLADVKGGDWTTYRVEIDHSK